MRKIIIAIAAVSLSCSGDFEAHYTEEPESPTPPKYTPNVVEEEQQTYLDTGLALHQDIRLPSPDSEDTSTGNPDQSKKPDLPERSGYHRITVALSWKTPGDSNTNDDCGTDIDLHLRPLRSEWGSFKSVYYGSPYGHWPPEGEINNWSLDKDVLNNTGDEHISAQFVQPLVHYVVGVHYYSDEAADDDCPPDDRDRFGEVHYSVEVWVDSNQEHGVSGTLTSRNEFIVLFEGKASGRFWNINDRYNNIRSANGE